MARQQQRIPDTIVSFNAKVGRGGGEAVDSAREIIKDNPGTDVILWQECEGYVDDLRRAFDKGWYVYARQGWPESLMNPVMVRKTDAFPKREYGGGWGTVRNRAHWTGPVHGNDKPGRTWTWVKVGDLWVMSLHRATDGDGQNRKAYREEAQRLATFMKRGQDRDVVIFGDTNTGLRADHKGSMQEIRAEVKGRLIADRDDPFIEYALTTRSITARVRRTKHYGSDHKAAVMTGIKVA